MAKLNIKYYSYLVIISFLSMLFFGCVTAKPNVSIIDQKYAPSKADKNSPAFLKAKSLLSAIPENNPILATELGKLPEFQDNVSSEEVSALEQIVKYYNTNHRKFDSVFSEMNKFGMPESRAYCSPLQAVLWGYMDGHFKEKDNPFKDYQGSVEFVKPIWGRMEGERWNNFNKVASRIGGSVELMNHYLNQKYTYEWIPGVGSYPSEVFKKKSGACYEIALMAVKMMKIAGRDAKMYWDTHAPRLAGSPSYIPYGHTIAATKVNDCMCIFVDWTIMGNTVHPCIDMKSFKERYTIRQPW